MLEHKVRRIGPVFILDLSGRVSTAEAMAFGPGSGITLRDIVRGLLEQGADRIVVNLKDVSYIDSSGIGEIFGLFTTLQRAEGRMVLLSPNPRVRDVMKLTRLDSVLQITDDEFEAVQSLTHPKAASG